MMILQGNKTPEDLPVTPAEEITQSQAQPDSTMRQMEKEMEKELADILKKALGTSEVNVMVNLASSERKVYEKNETSPVLD